MSLLFNSPPAMRISYLCAQILTFIFFSPGGSLASSDPLDVRLTTGTFRGATTPNGTEKWIGIPYAQPPVGDLRFKAPVPVPASNSSTVRNATTFGDACPQPPSDLGAPISENCLFLNVFRLGNTTANANLPVLLWIHGGQYTTGAASQSSFDPTRILLQSLSMNKPIIFVSINYRLNTFGFLASSLVEPSDLNMGLHDQRLAIKFTHDNIAAFGGDPSKITIWGQSAGAGSVEAHFIYPPSEPLFRAGIAESPVGPFKNSPDASVYDKPGKPFARLLANTGCEAGPDALSCLRQVPFDTLLNISNAMVLGTLNMQLWQPAVGPPGSFVPERASARIKRNDFLHLPFLGGTNLNEGTSFSVSVEHLNLTGHAENHAFINFTGHLVIDNSTFTPDVLHKFLTMWPANDTSLGAPFNTGDSLFDRAEAWYTDEMFLAPRRLFFKHAKGFQKMFAYFFTEFIPGNNPLRGVAHASELPLLFGPIPAVASIETDFANQYLSFYINFVNDLDPGAEWPDYAASQEGSVLQLMRNNITVLQDVWDVEKTVFLNTPEVLDEMEK